MQSARMICYRVRSDLSHTKALGPLAWCFCEASAPATRVDAAGVRLIFSFRNPDHEQRILREALPDVHVSVSCEVRPEIRDYELRLHDPTQIGRTCSTAHQWLTLSRLCRAIPCPDPQAQRRRDPRQSRLAQGHGRAKGDPRRWRAPCPPAEIPSRSQLDRAGLREVQNFAAKGPNHETVSGACGEILAKYSPKQCAAYIKNAGYA